MNEKEEQVYIQGSKWAYTNILMKCLKNLGINEPSEAKRLVWIEERQDAIEILRDLCNEFGDNDWSDDLYLQDIIEKHLAKHLWASAQQAVAADPNSPTNGKESARKETE
jgi:hypothetical protein